MKIFGLRYFSIKSQNTLFQLPDNLLPNQLFVYSLLQKRTLTYYGKNYTIRLIEQSNENSYLVGYFLKSVDLNLISLDEELFQEKEIENWEKVLFVVDQQLQIIAFEHNSGIAAPDNIQNVIELMVNALVQQWGYVIKIEFIIDKFRFWSIIDKSTGIFQIAFKLLIRAYIGTYFVSLLYDSKRW
jgi:predicted lipase